MSWHLDVERPAAEIVYCYAGSGTHLHADAPLLEVRLGNSPLQTLTYGEGLSAVVRRVLPEAALPIEALPVSVPLAVVESVQEGAVDAPEAVLIVSIFRQGYHQALLSLATWREDEQALVLEVVPARLEPSLRFQVGE